MNKQDELEKLAYMLECLAREGHGGSEARLVITLEWTSLRLREYSRNMEGLKRVRESRINSALIRLFFLAPWLFKILSLLPGSAG